MGSQGGSVQGCWASVVGGCRGPLTGEHLVSECVLAETVRVRGFEWCREEVEVGRASVTCNCLCDRHNNLLSDVDDEAGRLMKAIGPVEAILNAPAGAPFEAMVFDGLLMARWFAKTACNVAAASGKHVPLPLARYAFSESDDPSVGVYAATGKGDTISVSGNVSLCWVHDTTDPDRVAVHIPWLWLRSIISTFDLKAGGPAICSNDHPRGGWPDHRATTIDGLWRRWSWSK